MNLKVYGNDIENFLNNFSYGLFMAKPEEEEFDAYNDKDKDEDDDYNDDVKDEEDKDEDNEEDEGDEE